MVRFQPSAPDSLIIDIKKRAKDTRKSHYVDLIWLTHSRR
jgi:hypothetical protein